MKKFTANLLSQKGIGLLETIIAFAIIGIGTFLILQGLDQFDSSKSRVNKSINLESTLSSIVESVKANIVLEKVDFQADTTFLHHSSYNDVKNSLKLCWLNEGLIPNDGSSQCTGRLGYVVTPLKVGNLTLRGLYKVTVRLTHDELFPGSFKQYEFIVKGP